MGEQSEVAESGVAGGESQSPIGSMSAAYRVLSVRMSDDTRAQLEVLAQLNGRSVTEETRLGLEHWVEASKADPKVLERAEAVRAEIERDAETKRNAIAAVLGTSATPKTSGRTAGKATSAPR